MEYVINCKGTMIHPNYFKQVIDGRFTLDRDAKQKAVNLFMLASALPSVPAGVLLDLIDGKIQYTITENEDFIIHEVQS